MSAVLSEPAHVDTDTLKIRCSNILCLAQFAERLCFSSPFDCSGSTYELSHAPLSFPVAQPQNSNSMKADLPSFVLRCSISLKKRIYVVCNSDTAMQAERKRIQRNGIKHSAGTVCQASLLETLK